MAIENLPVFNAMNREEVKPPFDPCKPGMPGHPHRPLTSQEAHFAIMEKVSACIAEVNHFEHRVKEELDNFCDKTDAENRGFKEAIQASYNAFLETVQREVNNFETDVQNNFDLYRNDIDKRIADFQTAINNDFKTLQNNLDKVVDISLENMRVEFSTLRDEVDARLSMALETTNSKITELDALKISLNKSYQNFTSSINSIVSTFKTDIVTRVNGQDEKIELYKEYMVNNIHANTENVLSSMAAAGELTESMQQIFGSERRFMGSATLNQINGVDPWLVEVEPKIGDYYYCTDDENFYELAANDVYVNIGKGYRLADDYIAHKTNQEIFYDSNPFNLVRLSNVVIYKGTTTPVYVDEPDGVEVAPARLYEATSTTGEGATHAIGRKLVNPIAVGDEGKYFLRAYSDKARTVTVKLTYANNWGNHTQASVGLKLVEGWGYYALPTIYKYIDGEDCYNYIFIFDETGSRFNDFDCKLYIVSKETVEINTPKPADVEVVTFTRWAFTNVTGVSGMNGDRYEMSVTRVNNDSDAYSTCSAVIEKGATYYVEANGDFERLIVTAKGDWSDSELHKNVLTAPGHYLLNVDDFISSKEGLVNAEKLKLVFGRTIRGDKTSFTASVAALKLNNYDTSIKPSHRLVDFHPDEYVKSENFTPDEYAKKDEITDMVTADQLDNYVKHGDLVGPQDIICWGDSLTAGGGWTTRLASLTGRTVINAGTGGENVRTISARHGIDAIAINNVTIPAAVETIQLATYAEKFATMCGFKATPLLQSGSAHVNPVKIGDVEGTLTWTGSNYNDSTGVWTFTRATAGDAVTINRPTALTTRYDRDRAHYLQILFIGQNGGYTDVAELVDIHKRMIAHADCEYTLILGLSSGTATDRAEYEKQMKQAFGRYFISLREYLSEYGLEDAGLTATEEDTAAMEQGKTPPQLLTDTVHYTAACKTVIGNLIYKRGKELGIF